MLAPTDLQVLERLRGDSRAHLMVQHSLLWRLMASGVRVWWLGCFPPSWSVTAVAPPSPCCSCHGARQIPALAVLLRSQGPQVWIGPTKNHPALVRSLVSVVLAGQVRDAGR